MEGLSIEGCGDGGRFVICEELGQVSTGGKGYFHEKGEYLGEWN